MGSSSATCDSAPVVRLAAAMAAHMAGASVRLKASISQSAWSKTAAPDA